MATSDATEPRYWLIDNPHRDEPSLPEPASARGGAGPYLVPIVDEVYGGVIAWANTPDLADEIVAALSRAERAALIALVRWLGETTDVLLPIDLHAQVREALGDDFYRDVEGGGTDGV